MFWNRKSKLPVTEEDQDWVETSLAFLAQSIGEEPLLRLKTVTPTKAFFDRDFEGTETDAQFILERCASIMNIDASTVTLQFYSDTNKYLDDGTLLSTTADIYGKSSGAAGTYQKMGEKAIIRLERDQLQCTDALIATISHELAHEKLLGERRIATNDEYLTDLTAIAYGFGVFIANAKFQFQAGQKNGFGWQMQSQGYLPEQITAYAMASLSLKKKETAPSYSTYLNDASRRYFNQSLNYLQSKAYTKDTSSFWEVKKETKSAGKPIVIPVASAPELSELFYDPNNLTPESRFNHACINNDIATVVSLLEQGLSPNSVNRDVSGLYRAISQNHFALADLPLQAGADINFIREGVLGSTILENLCRTKYIVAVQYALANGAYPNLVGKIGDFPLFTAVEENNIEVAELLINAGALLEIKHSIYLTDTPLCLAARENSREMVSFLVSKGAKTKPLRKTDRKRIPAGMVKFLKAKKYL